MFVFAAANLDVVGWSCFAIGAILVLGGTVTGTLLALKPAAANATAKIAQAQKSLDDATTQLDRVGQANLESGGPDPKAAVAAKTEAAKSTLEEISGIIGALPEQLRFSGLVVLIGAVLMSVATIQFGHTSLF